MSDEDQTYNHQYKDTCQDPPKVSRRLPEEEDVQSQQTTDMFVEVVVYFNQIRDQLFLTDRT